MSEKKCGCKCKGKCKSNSQEWPVLIGGILVYELAIIIGLLALNLFACDAPCEKPHSCTLEPEETCSKEGEEEEAEAELF